ncbi:MAG: bifunctional oligoribonuclease/PAP phosphatase NrnA [Candidatus Izimaplasma sp.]|nr:bifunctional oligoribonuclease/PAP phosphatase NrnA [Candidatus Izimaplasma bacterium]
MDKDKLNQIYNTIKENKKLIIFPHGRPDGDAIGTSFGLKDIIETTWPDKTVYVVGESSDFTEYIGIPNDSLHDDEFKNSVAIMVDTSNKDRLSDQRYKLCKKTIKIDHHIEVETYGDISYVDTSRAAAALIILDLYILHKELKMTKKGAEALLFGILTDTGRFKYSSVSGNTFRNVAVLYDLGVNATAIYRYLDTTSEELIRFKGFLLQNIKKTKNGVAYFKVLPKYLEEFSVSLEEATSLVNELGKFKDCPIWLLFAEYEEGIVRARMRSKGPHIDKLANEFDGGGHPFACGANLGTWDRTDSLIEASDKLAKTYKLENE